MEKKRHAEEISVSLEIVRCPQVDARLIPPWKLQQSGGSTYLYPEIWLNRNWGRPQFLQRLYKINIQELLRNDTSKNKAIVKILHILSGLFKNIWCQARDSSLMHNFTTDHSLLSLPQSKTFPFKPNFHKMVNDDGEQRSSQYHEIWWSTIKS